MMKVKDLDLSARALRVLDENRITNVYAFLALREIEVMRWEGAGRQTWSEIYHMQVTLKEKLGRGKIPHPPLDAWERLRNCTQEISVLLRNNPNYRVSLQGTTLVPYRCEAEDLPMRVGSSW